MKTFDLAEQWASDARLQSQDLNDPVYQQYLAALTAEKMRQRTESNHEPKEAIEREFAIAAELNSPDTDIRFGSLQSIVRAAADCRIDAESEMFMQYEAELDAERERQCREAEREADAVVA